jgi:hypothetical protein
LILFNKHSIVQWRNDEIGHGALSFESDEEFQKDITGKVSAIRDFFASSIEDFKKLTLIVKENGNEVVIRGAEALDKISQNTTDVFVRIEGRDQKLYPYILNNQSKIYFFDSYYSLKKKASILNYLEGKKLMNEEVNNLLGCTYRALELYNCSKGNFVDNKTFSKVESDILNKIGEINDFAKPDYIYDWLKDSLLKNSKGVMLLQMERGTGKTTFSRSIDQLSLNKYKNMEEYSTRAYYINDSYSYKINNFVQGISDLMRLDKYGKSIINCYIAP